MPEPGCGPELGCGSEPGCRPEPGSGSEPRCGSEPEPVLESIVYIYFLRLFHITCHKSFANIGL